MFGSWKRYALAGTASIVVALGASSSAVAAATPLYPNLHTLEPRDLRFDRADVSADGSGVMHNVLRFSNTAWNSGPGILELRAHIDQSLNPPAGTAIQRVYNSDGSYTDYNVGRIYYHAAHNHYHFDNWGEFELWTKAAYDSFKAGGSAQPMIVGNKTTSCVTDEEEIQKVPNMPFPGNYPWTGCMPDSSNNIVEGLSPGWGDTYDWYRSEQWIDLNQSTLADGNYVLRSVADPDNIVYESAGKSDTSKESIADNEAITPFTVSGGKILDGTPPTGTVMINDISTTTSSPNVTVRVLGRDDVSGVDKVRLSNDGSTWTTAMSYTGSGSGDMSVSWNLTDSRYGGTNATGDKTVYVQFHDASGKWGPTETDTIKWQPASGYEAAVLADSPLSYWRLDETGNAGTAVDETGVSSGAYVGSPTLGAPGLLPAESTDRSMSLSGSGQYVRVPDNAKYHLQNKVSLEAWIKPAALPAAGQFASVVTRAESESIQFNGPRLEFTVMQNGTRQRLQAPSGAIGTGQVYHVVGTYDGTTQRLYINGQEVANRAQTGNVSDVGANITIGSWDGSMEYFKGQIDEVAIYGSALPAASVLAHYNSGTGQTNPTPTPPTAPDGLAATAASDTQVNLSWNDNSNNETSFVLERGTNSDLSAGFVSTTLPAGTTSRQVTGLSASTTYYFRVKAVNSAGDSAYSQVVSATTKTPAPPSGYASEVTADAPVSWWRLAEPSGTFAGDQRGANNGSYVNGPGLGAAGLLASETGNSAVSFGGVSAFMRVPDAASLDLSSGFSVEAWIKPGLLPAAGSFASVLTKAEDYSIQFNGPRLEFTVMQNGARKRLQAPSGAVQTGQVYHVVGTYDGTTQRLYLNGVQVASAALTGNATLSTSPLTVGSWDGTMEYFNGTIDEPAVYNKVLTAARVSAHYTAGSTAGTPTKPDAPSGLSATATSDTQVNVSWTDNSTDEQSFVLQRSTDSSFASGVTSTTLPANTSQTQVSGLSPSTTYYFRIKASNSAGDSAYTATASATTKAPGYSSVVLADNPVSYWRLGEQSGTAAADQRGANNGTYFNSPGLGAQGLIPSDSANSAVSFNGISSYMKVSDSPSLRFTNAFTLEAWIRPGLLPASGSFSSVMTKAESYSIQFNGPRLEFTVIQNGVRQRLQTAAGALQTGQTYNVIATFDGTTQRLYVNGAQVANRALSGSASVTGNALTLGSWDGTMEYFNGTIDEAAVYNTVMNATRVAAHWDSGHTP